MANPKAKPNNALSNVEGENLESMPFSQMLRNYEANETDYASCCMKVQEPQATPSEDEEKSEKSDGGENEGEEEEDTSTIANEQQNKIKLPRVRRKYRSKLSGRRRAIWAWEKNLRDGSDRHAVAYGGEGWPPPFRSFVREMRERLIKETGKTEGWDEDDVSMLRKYFYLKHNIQANNTSSISIHVKLASMSQRCYDMTQKIMDMYETGQLERKRKNDKILLAIHATYFDFLYSYNVREKEEETFALLTNVCLQKKRPDRKQLGNLAKRKSDEKSIECEKMLKKAKNDIIGTKKELVTYREENKVLKQKISKLEEALENKEKELKNLQDILLNKDKDLEIAKKDHGCMRSSLAQKSKELQRVESSFAVLQKDLEKTEKGNELMASSLAVNTKEIQRMKKNFAALQEEIERLKNTSSDVPFEPQEGKLVQKSVTYEDFELDLD